MDRKEEEIEEERQHNEAYNSRQEMIPEEVLNKQ